MRKCHFAFPRLHGSTAPRLASLLALFALLVTGCSQADKTLQPYTAANRGTQGPPANYRSLARIQFGLTTDKGWESIPLGRGQEKAREALLKRAISSPKNLNMATTGATPLTQLVERINSNVCCRQMLLDRS